MAVQYPNNAFFIQENNGDPFLPLQGFLEQRIIQNPYAVAYTITEAGMNNPSVVLTATRNNNYNYDLAVTERPNGDLGDYIAEFAEDNIPANEVGDKIGRIYDAYIGMGGGRRRRRRTHRNKKLSRRRRRSLGRRRFASNHSYRRR